MKWLGEAIVRLGDAHASRADGFEGARMPVACDSSSMILALGQLSRELRHYQLILVGLNSLVPVDLIDRDLTEEEEALIAGLRNHPVQFQTVYLKRELPVIA